jgi:hypothetical protein
MLGDVRRNERALGDDLEPTGRRKVERAARET